MTKRNDIDTLRNLSGDIWNVAVDEHQAGFLKRRDLLKYAALIGLTGFAASQGLVGFGSAALPAPAARSASGSDSRPRPSIPSRSPIRPASASSARSANI